MIRTDPDPHHCHYKSLQKHYSTIQFILQSRNTITDNIVMIDDLNHFGTISVAASQSLTNHEH